MMIIIRLTILICTNHWHVPHSLKKIRNTESKGLLKLIVSFFKLFGLIDVIRFHGVVKGAQNMKFKPYGIEIEP